MEAVHTIGRLAERTGLATSTVRYYERTGLLQPSGRTSGNHRVYSECAVDRVRFIRAAQATGFTLADIRKLLEFRDGTDAPCGDVRPLIEQRLAAVEKRMGELRHVSRVLKGLFEACRNAEQDEPCHVLDKLSLGDEAHPLTIQVLYFDGCPSYAPTLECLREVVLELGVEAAIEAVEVRTDDDARRLQFLGSPTVRVDGRDIAPAAAARDQYGFSCRIYGGSGVPSRELIRSAIVAGSTS